MTTWVERLVQEYGAEKSLLEEYRKKLDQSEPDEKDESSIVGGMISDMSYTIEWLKKGRRPGSRRGAESRDAYRKSALMDMDLFPSLDLHTPETVLSNEQKKMIVDALLELSTRERQCYILHMANGWSLAEVAAELQITKRSAQQYVDRAKEKIKSKNF
ncbi:sigma-70 family RNA polymerase sigma factor [Paenibacillus eucommiae]|uniref:RNA polymerase sigma-70 factor (ECF subfamily) n=1 Tax=Paenibacillus eucommiae TaxID=1355755 RepID=A0ABS4IRP9_9BACL|nr:sigma-70 family RNA polymerase sigma factor [Paenibacillus eucommiae]MBP1990215.1 RNA polymerase sigma-70 factor (ECF subfamily) [Paenibacillus eucommiae]